MEIKVFTSNPGFFENMAIPHSNDLFCDDEYDNTDFPYLWLSSGQCNLLIVAIEGNNVIGGIQLLYTENGWLMTETNHQPKWCMLGMGVNKGYEGKGIATKLIEKQFEVMTMLGIDDVCQSGYSPHGLDTIYKTYERLIERNPHISYINTKRLF